MALAAATAWTQRTAPAPQRAQLNVLSVGSGQCAVLRTPNGETFLLDAGAQAGTDIFETTLGPFLRERRLPMPQTCFLSHGNIDHLSGALEWIRSGDVERVYVSEHFGRGDDERSPANVVLEVCRDAGAEVIRLHPGQVVPLDERTRVEVLWPPAEPNEPLSTNECSLVLRLVCDDTAVLTTGDIETIGEAALTVRANDVRSDALLLPHHGSWEPTLPAFVAAVDPEVVIVSAGHALQAPLRGGEAAETFCRELTRRRLFNTSQTGWVLLEFGGGSCRVTRTMR